MTNETHDRMHELLCAYVLGEASADERAEVERALEASAELRQEKERVEATIGLVKTVLVQDETLSSQKREAVLRAGLLPVVKPPAERPWWGRTWVRAAAAVLVVSFGFAGWSVYERHRPLPASSVDVATRSRSDENRRTANLDAYDDQSAVAPQDRLAQLDSRAAESTSKASPQADPSAAKSLSEVAANVPAEEARKAGEMGNTGVRDAGVTSAATPQSQTATRDQEKLVDASLDAKITERLFDESFDKRQVELKNEPNFVNDSVESNLFRLQEVPPSAPGAVAPGTETERERDGSDAFFLGAAGAREPQHRAGFEVLKKAAGPSTPAPSGPATGGPAARSAPAGGAGSVPGSVGTGAENLQTWSAKPIPSGEVGGKDALEQQILRFEREQAGLAGFGYLGDLEAAKLKRDGGELSDEDRFILERLRAEPGFVGVGGIMHVTPELRARYRDEYIDHWCRRIVLHCRRLPNERPRDMFFRYWGDNPFEFAALDPLSTFSADVDTASYVLARRYVNEGHLPEKAQVRTEEFVNAFKADVPPPQKGTFAIYTTLAPSRYGTAGPHDGSTSARDLLRVVIRGKDVPKAERKPLALTFVVDCSGSMKEQDRMGMVKHAMRQLVNQLDARDSIAIVKFSTEAAMVLPMTSASQRDKIEAAIHPLVAEGSTNSEAGLRVGYEAALKGLNVEATNRVVFLSDGVANVGVTDPNVISEGVRAIREKGVYLNTIGVGMNNHNDVLLEQLADKGDGVCNYVDRAEEVQKAFVDQFMGAVETIARDVKLQVEFDPAQVSRYRLLGYENRAVADADFRNDKVDAGEIGAGHQVTALYEIEYANPSAASEKPLAVVRVRHKAPRNPGAPTANEEATEIAQPVLASQRTSWEGAGPGYRRTAIVAQYAEFLRRSVHARQDSFEQMLADARKLEAESRDGEVTELVTLMEKAKVLILNGWPARDELSGLIDDYRMRCLEQARRESDREFVAQVERENRELEARLRELLRRRLDSGR
jgi:Ca-activated chloride channel family protein